MATATETQTSGGVQVKPAVEILVQTLKQSQKVMDLETGDENATIDLVMKKYIAPEYDAKTHAPLTEEEFNAVVLESAAALVQPVGEQIKAFLNKATSDSYQAAKTAALAKGNFLTTDLKARIIMVMRGNQNFADNSAKECFDKWKAGFMAKKAGATKVLDTAKALGDFDDL